MNSGQRDGDLAGIRACVFDAYGTLFDFASAAAGCRDVLGDQTAAVTALLTIPFDTLGVDPQNGASWRINFVRNRSNVRQERSAWGTGGEPARLEHFGVMVFQ